MNIKITANFVYLYPSNEQEYKLLEELHNQVIIKFKKYNPYKKCYEDEIITLLAKTKNGFKFLTGYCPLFFSNEFFKKYCKSFKSSFYPDINFNPIDKNLLYQDKIYSILRDYQKEAIEHILEAPRGIFEGVMGSGKTLIMIAICKAIKPDIPILIIIPKSQALLEQTIERFLQYFDKKEIGYNYGKGYKEGRIIISSPGCLSKLSLNYYLITLIDECHTTPSSTIANALLQMNNTYFRYGFSGTPIGRSDKRDWLTIGLIGKIYDYKITYVDLEKEKFVAECEYYIINFNSEKLLDKGIFDLIFSERTEKFLNEEYYSSYNLINISNYSWKETVDYFIVNNKTRNSIIFYLLGYSLKANRNCLIIVERIEHGQQLLELFNKYFPSLKVEFIFSKHNNISKILNDFRTEQLKVLIATQLIEIGIDIPNVNTIILASIGKSSIQLLQRIGRGLRPKENQKLIVFDLCDTANGILKYHAYLRKQYITNHKIPIKEFSIKKNLQEEIKNLTKQIYES